MKKVLPYILAILLLVSAVAHVLIPGFYAPLVPDFIPLGIANILATLSELVIAVMLFVPRYRRMGGLLFMFLMILFLPLHIWDMFKENPMVGASPSPQIRLILQFVLIYAGWWIFKKNK